MPRLRPRKKEEEVPVSAPGPVLVAGKQEPAKTFNIYVSGWVLGYVFHASEVFSGAQSELDTYVKKIAREGYGTMKDEKYIFYTPRAIHKIVVEKRK